MFKWKFVLFVALAFEALCIVRGNLPPTSDVEIHYSTQFNQSEEQLYDEQNHGDPADLSLAPAIKEIRSADKSPIYDARSDLPANCAETTASTQRSGYYFIKFPALANEIALVECDALTDGGDWTVIQRRRDGSVDFYLNWSAYKAGFGDIDTEYFIGLQKLYALTNFDGAQELLILMELKNGTAVHAKYDLFAIGNESEKYILKKLGKYTGTAGDSLRIHRGCKFSTKDQKNDNSSNVHCAQHNKGAWWYNSCYESNLNGLYGIDTNQGVMWRAVTALTNSLKSVKMMIRRQRQ